MPITLNRRRFLTATGTAALAGCVGDREGAGKTSTAGTVRTPTARPAGIGESPSSSEKQTSSTQETRTTTDEASSGPPTQSSTLPLPLPPKKLRNRAVSGGPPKDGIPSIDDPAFEDASTGSKWLSPEDPVFGVPTAAGGKAYPQSILVWHEVCNDLVDGTPVSVTYCPLTGTAMGFERGETTFGVSGRLVNNNLIMYDRATETWWPQVLATAIPGPWNTDPTIRSLREFRVVWTTWKRWRERFPETAVLSRVTGYARNYTRDPYGSYNPRRGYYAPSEPPMFSPLFEDSRLAPKRVVIGARVPGDAIAIEKSHLQSAGIVAGKLAGTQVIAVWDPSLATGYLYRNPQEESFTHRGEAIEGPDGTTYQPHSLPLDGVLAFDAMWFAWAGFYPETSLHA